MRKSVLGISAALALGLLATPFLLARGGEANCPLGMGAKSHGAMMFGGHFGGHGRLGAMAHVARELDLTAEQKEAFHRIHEATHEKNAATRAAVHDGLMNAARILIANPQDVAAARTEIANREAAIDELKENALAAVSQGLAVLTPEQRAKLLRILEEHHQKQPR
jgi:Spy/CpxP family protein refolding chaperone